MEERLCLRVVSICDAVHQNPSMDVSPTGLANCCGAIEVAAKRQRIFDGKNVVKGVWFHETKEDISLRNSSRGYFTYKTAPGRMIMASCSKHDVHASLISVELNPNIEDKSPSLDFLPESLRLQTTQYFDPVTISTAVANPLASRCNQDTAFFIAAVAQMR